MSDIFSPLMARSSIFCFKFVQSPIINKCRKSDSSVLIVVLQHLRYKIAGKNILANNKVIIKGLSNIHTNGLLQIGMAYVGFMHTHDITYLNINGSLIFQDNYSIGKGCRFDIGNGAIAKFGSGYVNSNTNFIIMHGITVGDGCAISWGCEFLDEDFHHIAYKEKKERTPEIEIGSRVWIGSNVTILKGSRIPDGCVIASGSVVSSRFEITNCLIGGNPAKVIRENVEWK
jgi:acetyltransferase-like isoleucine patch superfamily enzyme